MDQRNDILPSFFRLAKKASKFSDHRYKLGAVILKNGKPISTGYNLRYKFHSLTRKYGSLQSIHAEVSAIINIKNKALLEGATIVVYRSTPSGNTAMAKPCETCHRIIREFGFKRMVFSTPNGYSVEYL